VSTQTVQSAGVAAMPRVNLMPPEIAEAERLRKLQLAMGCAVLASAAIVGLLYMHEKSGVSGAQQQLATAQAQQTSLQAKLTGLNTVAQTFAEVQGKQALLNQAMGQEIRWSYVLNDLTFKLPTNLWLNTITANETTAGATAIAPTTTATTLSSGASSSAAPIGTVAFSVTGRKHDDIAAWLDALAKVRGFADPTFLTSAEGSIGSTPVVNAGTNVNVTTGALSNKYTTGSGS
jgi:Tfp pilus assembly protein PilN